MTSPILSGSGSLSDQIFAGLTSQGFDTGTISDRERARLLAKLALAEPQGLTIQDLYSLAVEPQRLSGFLGSGQVIENALLTPEAFGYPGQSNTGVIGGISAPEPGGIDIFVDDTIIENREIDGDISGYGLFVNANNVIIRNCIIYCIPEPAGGCIVIDSTRTGIIIEDCEFFYNGPGSYRSAIIGGQYIMRRCNMHDISEGPRVGTNCQVRNNWIHDVIGDDVEAHTDMLQVTSGLGAVIDTNTFVASVAAGVGNGPASGCCIIGSELEETGNLQFTNNLLGGDVGVSPGQLLLVGEGAFPMHDMTFTGNRFGRNQWVVAALGVVQTGIDNLVFANNVFDDNNEALELE